MPKQFNADNFSRVQSVSSPFLGQLEVFSSGGEYFLAKHLPNDCLSALSDLKNRLPFLFQNGVPEFQEFLEFRELFTKQYALFKYYDYPLDRYLEMNTQGKLFPSAESVSKLLDCFSKVISTMGKSNAFLPLLNEKLIFISSNGELKIAHPLLFDSFYKQRIYNERFLEEKLSENWQEAGRILLRHSSLCRLGTNPEMAEVLNAMRIVRDKMPYYVTALLKKFNFGLENDYNKTKMSCNRNISNYIESSPLLELYFNQDYYSRAPGLSRNKAPTQQINIDHFGSIIEMSTLLPQKENPFISNMPLNQGENPLYTAVGNPPAIDFAMKNATNQPAVLAESKAITESAFKKKISIFENAKASQSTAADDRKKYVAGAYSNEPIIQAPLNLPETKQQNHFLNANSTIVIGAQPEYRNVSPVQFQSMDLIPGANPLYLNVNNQNQQSQQMAFSLPPVSLTTLQPPQTFPNGQNGMFSSFPQPQSSTQTAYLNYDFKKPTGEAIKSTSYSPYVSQDNQQIVQNTYEHDHSFKQMERVSYQNEAPQQIGQTLPNLIVPQNNNFFESVQDAYSTYKNAQFDDSNSRISTPMEKRSLSPLSVPVRPSQKPPKSQEVIRVGNFGAINSGPFQALY